MIPPEDNREKHDRAGIRGKCSAPIQAQIRQPDHHQAKSNVVDDSFATKDHLHLPDMPYAAYAVHDRPLLRGATIHSPP